MQTMLTLNENERSSAPVNLPQTPKDILLPSEHGRIMYWHMGSKRNASATVAITGKIKLFLVKFYEVECSEKNSAILNLLTI